MKVEFGNYEVSGKKGDWIVKEISIIQKEGKTKGDKYVSEENYFGRLYQVLNFLLNCRLGESDKSSVKGLKDEINTIGVELKELADKIEKQYEK